MKINRVGIFIIAAFLAFALWVALSGEAKAQDNYEAKVYVGFINGSYNYPVVNNQGVNVSAQYKVYGYGPVKVEAVADASIYLRGANVYTFLAGPQVSVDLFHNRLTPFARTMFGATRYRGDTYYAHSIGAGVDVNVTKRFSVRPVVYDKQSTDRNGQPVHRIGVGVAYKF